MAYTSVIPVYRLDNAVRYAQDKQKTTRQHGMPLAETVDYALNREKTETDGFESGLGCTTQSAYEDMRANAVRWHKTDGVQGYHLVQSFAEGEVTPELAHKIGLELAERVLGGRHQAIVTTHLNTSHYHNHIVWSSVAMNSGRKYHSNAKSYALEIRAVSDELCVKYGLSIIQTERAAQVSKPYAEWLAEKNGQPTWRTVIRQDVDAALAEALTWRQFIRELESKGYELNFNHKYPTLRPPGKTRPVRFKTLGRQYTSEALQIRILYPDARWHFLQEQPPVAKHARLRKSYGKARRLTGLRALYYRYLYELGALPHKPRRPSYAVRQDIRNLDRRMAQLKAMYKNDWESLVGLCDEFLYLGGNEQGTHKYVSELIGKETISIASYNRSRGRNGSYSVNRQTSGRELLKPDEVRLLGDDKAILFVRGERPILDDKYDLLRHPNIRFTEDGGASPYDYTAAAGAANDLPGQPEQYELLDMDDFEDKPKVSAQQNLQTNLIYRNRR